MAQSILIFFYFYIDSTPKISSLEKRGSKPSKKDIYIMGNSHPECAINDKLLPNKFINISNSSEPLFYTCARARFLLQHFKNDSIIIEFTNISPMTIDWVISDQHFIRNAKKNHMFQLDRFQLAFLFNENRIKFIKAIMSLGFFEFINKNRINGEYVKLNRHEISSKVKNFKNRWIPTYNNYEKYSIYEKSINFTELQRLIKDFPNTHFIILRSPLHRSFEYFNENEYNEHVESIRKNQNVSYYDLSFSVTNDKYFGDSEHLNYLGANLFTPLFLKEIRNKSSFSNNTLKDSN